MFQNYFKTAWRNLIKNKGFTLLNITGLALGMASAILIILWIQSELTFDKFNAKGDRLYILANQDKFNGEVWAWSFTPKILAPTIAENYPDVETYSRFNECGFLFTEGDKRLTVSGAFVDTGFLNMFSLPLQQGDPGKVLTAPDNIVLTSKLANKLFGTDKVLGKVVRIDSSENFTVTGVLADLPENTRFNFEYLVPWSFMSKLGWNDSSWGNNSVTSYVLLKPGVSQASFNKKIRNTTINHTSGRDKSGTKVFTQPFEDAYLYNYSEHGQFVAGRLKMVRLFMIIAAFILIIACINFMNLSTARSEKRSKEVGIRKVVGAPKGLLIAQFLGESILISFLAGVVAIGIVALSLPAFNQLVEKQLSMQFGNPYHWLFAFAFILVTGLIAGSYPAFFLSSFSPVRVLKGTFKAANALVTPRKLLVILQFTFAITLIICTIIITNQIRHAKERDTGYEKDKVVFVSLTGDIGKNFELIKNDLLKKNIATGVTKSMSPITQRYSDGWGIDWDGSTEDDRKTDFVRMATDADFVKTLGVKLVEGRDIDVHTYPTDSTAVLLNETAVKIMRLKNPLGVHLKDNGVDWHVVGVLKDFIYESPYQKIQQVIVYGPSSWFNTMHFKFSNARTVSQNLKLAEDVFKTYNTTYPFEYHFADEAYEKKFDDQQRTGNLAALFAGLTIFISCLGLFGLATYMAQNRIKEIGVRKVLGASVASITTLLSKDFLKLVIISLLIASPLAWWAMNNWLNDFDYRITIQWWVFAVTAIIAVAIAILTVSFQAIKAAIANPVESLRTE